MKIIVTGLIGAIPLAGLTFHYLQYVLGLKKMGHEVLYLEDTGTWCFDPVTDGMVEDSTAGINYLKGIMHKYGLEKHWAFLNHDQQLFGTEKRKLRDFIKTADLFINVTGAGLVREEYGVISKIAYVDTDPGFIQVRLANNNEQDRAHLNKHNVYFSFGCNIGRPDCSIPSGGYDWLPTVQPICLDLWPIKAHRDNAPFTTVMKWKSYAPEEYGGSTYGLKDMELQHYFELPGLTKSSLELAISGNPPKETLRKFGWALRNALEVSRSVDAYQQYIQQSQGEWSIAKNAYVSMRSGWFSERSACYLASGRPVVVQETGFSDWLHPDGYGVWAFSDIDGAQDGLNRITAEYSKHSDAARAVAEKYFAAEIVLSSLINAALE